MRSLRARLTYANVMSSVAVFMVLGGSAYGDESNAASSGRAARDGFQLFFSIVAAGQANAHGTYAVTG